MTLETMYNYELLPKLRHLALVGQNEDGELEWIGTSLQWRIAKLEEEFISNGINYETNF